MIALEQRHALGVLIRSARWARRQAVCQSASRQSASPATCRRCHREPCGWPQHSATSMQISRDLRIAHPYGYAIQKASTFRSFSKVEIESPKNLPRSPSCSPVRVRNSESEHFSKVFEGRDRISKIFIDLPTHKASTFPLCRLRSYVTSVT